MLFWADIDNAPHVLVLRPIIAWLKQQGHDVEITARDYGQTIPLLELFGMPHTVIGKHAGKSKFRKVMFFFNRSFLLFLYARKRRFAAVFCHGTRGVFLPARLLRVPLVMITDYEHGALPRFMMKWQSLLLAPDVIPSEMFVRRGLPPSVLRSYSGLKEELYVYDSEPDPSVLEAAGVDPAKPIVLIRPPASMAHYHVREGDELFMEVLHYFRGKPGVQVILLPRTKDQEADLRRYLERNASPNINIPKSVGYGPSLIYYSDLVVSGGGTMNREAACMGTPVFTIFKGPMGSVDRFLIEQGRLRVLENAAMLDSVKFEKVRKPNLKARRKIREELVKFIGKAILSVARDWASE